MGIVVPYKQDEIDQIRLVLCEITGRDESALSSLQLKCYGDWNPLRVAVVHGIHYAEAHAASNNGDARKQIIRLRKAVAELDDAIVGLSESVILAISIFDSGLGHGQFEKLLDQANSDSRKLFEILSSDAEPVVRPGRPGNPGLYFLVSNLGEMYRELTECSPESGIRHHRDPDQYVGPFFDLVKAVAAPIKWHSDSAGGKAIIRALGGLREMEDS